jgi:putative ABC transport system permease protein
VHKHEETTFQHQVIPSLWVTGRFDPNKLPGFDPLSRVPLETYYPPVATGANAASRAALGGEPLRPTRNLGGYLAQPPLMLTTLRSLRAFDNPSKFEGASPKAPISVVRVRVAGVTGPDPLSLKRIRAAAQLIHSRTGLAVDITAGSSPAPMVIDLPKGRFGQPPLQIREGWTAKNVAVRYLRALDQKSLLLFILVLVSCCLFLINASLASVRSRRVEIGTLLCIGWSQRNIFRAILFELSLVGLLTGIVGVVLTAVLVNVLSLHIAAARTLLVLPIAVILALVAGYLPARRAAAATPMDAVEQVTLEGGKRRPVRGLPSMAVANLTRVPGRTVLGASGLVIGVAALTLLIALNEGFHNTLVGTLLGNEISVQVRGVDFVSAALVIGLGALSVADVLYINLKERQSEIATLRTCGWKNRHLGAVIAIEGLATGLAGGIVGAVLGVVSAGLVRGIPILPIVLAGAIAALCGVVAAALASLVPAGRIASIVPWLVLAEE